MLRAGTERRQGDRVLARNSGVYSAHRDQEAQSRTTKGAADSQDQAR